MSSDSKIEWTEATLNPIRARHRETGKVGWHCVLKSPGCTNCYAQSMNKRLGTGLPYTKGSEREIGLFLDEKTLAQPLRWKKPRLVFTCSMTDLFADFVPDEWIDRIFAIMFLCPQHTFQVLTKRSDRMLSYLTHRNRPGLVQIAAFAQDHGYQKGDRESRAQWFMDHPMEWPLPNVWEGVSVESQKYADERIPHLLETPASVRFLSVEPLLGPVDLSSHLPIERDSDGSWRYRTKFAEVPRIHLVIVGGESGAGARPCDIDWIRSIVTQCKVAGVACFVKQMGGNAVDCAGRYKNWPWPRPAINDLVMERVRLKDGKGGDPSEWPEDLRVRQMPGKPLMEVLDG